ncbi:DUF3800 domain-containing protein [Candidatus Roizmanbacteria bacterium]|nr:DUF3800 domain-containing protein [Candidatus Roizmanbacteria bacterium]
MKKATELLEEQYFFVDEAGDPVFYDKKGKYIVGEEGCSKILLLGFIRTTNPIELRKEINALRHIVINDPFYQGIPSIKKTSVAFHAKDDIPEIREKVFKKIVSLDFKAEFIVGRKIEKTFANRYKGKEHLFYDDLIVKLFENKLHLAKKTVIYFSTRGSKIRQKPLEDAINKAKAIFEKKWKVKIDVDVKIYAQTPSTEPCLQIIDYMNWAVQRAFTKNEERYYKFVEDKVSFLCDIYDTAQYPKNYYNQKNKFELKKISPL